MPFAPHQALSAVFPLPTPESPELKSTEQLARIVTDFAASEGWLDRVRLSQQDRWYERLHHGPDYDIWAISWMPGQSTGFHDHGDSAGAFVVATGTLVEYRPGHSPAVIRAGQPRAFGSAYAHDVRNIAEGPAVSIHAYSPPLTEMNEFEESGNGLVPREYASARVAALDHEWHERSGGANKAEARRSIEHMLAEARAKLQRLGPEEAREAALSGAVLVDIRPEAQRLQEGQIPGALVVERNVLEWRFDPASEARLPIATDHDLHVIVFCSEGYTSSLAAAALKDLGLWAATDIEGGFKAWQAAGLPVVAQSSYPGRCV